MAEEVVETPQAEAQGTATVAEVEAPEQPEQPEQPEPAEQPEQPEQPEAAEATEASEATEAPALDVPGRDYEIIFIIDPTIDEPQIQEVTDRTRSVVEQAGGAIMNLRVSEMRRLAYSIKKRNEGIYTVINARGEPAVMRELDRVLKLEERVLRHMILRLDED